MRPGLVVVRALILFISLFCSVFVRVKYEFRGSDILNEGFAVRKMREKGREMGKSEKSEFGVEIQE